jgi:glycosyltransferase involved in cell wall biosynthesis
VKTLPLVTVITPTYNRADYLPETIDSVLAQGYSNLEYLVLDDGSDDHTSEVLHRYDPFLTWSSHPNVGEAQTVNRGLARAKGDLVVVVNSDDPILPGLVHTLSSYMNDNPDVLAAYPDWYKIDQYSKPMSEVYRREYNYEIMLKECICLVGPGAFIRRSALKLENGRDPQFRYVGDFDFWLRLGIHGKFARVPETLATHRVHAASATVAERGARMAEEHIQMYERLFARSDLPLSVKQWQTQSLGTVYYMAAAQALSESYPQARRYFMHSFQLSKRPYLENPSRFLYLLSTLLLSQSTHKWLFQHWKAFTRI